MSIAANSNRISSFIQFDPQESFEREYFIAHTSMRRFRLATIGSILLWTAVCSVLLFVLIMLVVREDPNPFILLVSLLVPLVSVTLYYSLRRLRIAYGYATLTNKRIVYYEYNAHEAVNYHYVKSLYLDDITAAQFYVERTLFRKSFLMALYTEFKALAVGGRSWQGFLKMFAKSEHLEPGPDAVEFVQAMSGQIAHRQFDPQASSHTA